MANKKINQLVAKTTIQSTDLFPIGDATTGTLYKKTIADLQAAIGGAVVSVNGLIGTVVLDTDDIAELATPTNKYFTDARARAAISLTTTGSSGASTYSSSTGVLNVPTYTLAGLGGITATFLSGGTGITYNSSTGVIATTITQYTDALARATLSASAPLSYNSTTGAFTISQANSTTNGYLSSTDWNTFNGKQSALSGGTAGYVTFWTNESTLGADSAHFWDNTNKRLGLGTTTPDKLFHAYFNSTSTTTFDEIAHFGSGAGKSLYIGTNAYGFSLNDTTASGGWGIDTNNDSGFFRFYLGASEKMRIQSNGYVGIGTTTPGEKLEIYAGSAAAAFINFRGNANTTSNSFVTIGQNSDDGGYFWNRKASFLSFGTSNTERVRITSGGVTLINTTSVVSNEKLTVKGSTNIWGVVRIENDTNQADVNHGTLHLVNTRTTYAIGNEASIMFSAYNSTGSMQPRATIGMQVASDLGGDLVFNTRNNSGSGERMRILSDGKVAIGATTAFASSQFNVVTQNAGGVIGLFYDSPANTNMYWYAFSTHMVIEARTGNFASYRNIAMLPSGGNLLVGTLTDNGERLYVGGSIRATGTITANSDISLKKNLAKIENAIEKVEQINGYTYEFKADDSKRHAGVIAQEIQEVLPEIVNKGNDGILGVEYGNISALLIEAIKEQQAQINELKALLNK